MDTLSLFPCVRRIAMMTIDCKWSQERRKASGKKINKMANSTTNLTAGQGRRPRLTIDSRLVVTAAREWAGLISTSAHVFPARTSLDRTNRG
jgi:hypothetical protein